MSNEMTIEEKMIQMAETHFPQCSHCGKFSCDGRCIVESNPTDAS